MSAPITKDQFTFSLGNLTYIDSSYDEGAAPIVKPEPRGFGAWLAARGQAFAGWWQHRTVMDQMARMTDRELSDIGLTRSDLPRVFDVDFITDRARGRDYVAY